jgi:hypothetical protein
MASGFYTVSDTDDPTQQKGIQIGEKQVGSNNRERVNSQKSHASLDHHINAECIVHDIKRLRAQKSGCCGDSGSRKPFLQPQLRHSTQPVGRSRFGTVARECVFCLKIWTIHRKNSIGGYHRWTLELWRCRWLARRITEWIETIVTRWR